jgi:hypothetical protein
LTETFLFAKDLVDIGLQIAAFYIIVPYPGSVLYDYAAANNHLPEIPDLPNMKFAIPTMINTKVPPEVLHYNRRLVYQLINRKGVIEVKHGKNVGSQEDGVDIEADLAKISGRDMSLGVN